MLVLGDEILGKNSHCSKKLVEKYNETNNQIIAVKEVPEEIKSNYGIIEGEEVTENLYLINKMIEKPKKEDTDSQLAIIGRYVLNSSIFDTLQKELENKTYDFTKAIYKNKGDKNYVD